MAARCCHRIERALATTLALLFHWLVELATCRCFASVPEANAADLEEAKWYAAIVIVEGVSQAG